MASGGTRADIKDEENWFIGEDRTINIDVVQSDDSTPQTMTGWALTWELLDKEGGAVKKSWSTGGGEISIVNGDGTDDRAQITVKDTDTEGLVAKTYYHRLRRTDAGSEVVLAWGEVVLKAGFS